MSATYLICVISFVMSCVEILHVSYVPEQLELVYNSHVKSCFIREVRRRFWCKF